MEDPAGNVAQVQDGTDSCYDDEIEVIQETVEPVTRIVDQEWSGVENLLDASDNEEEVKEYKGEFAPEEESKAPVDMLY